MENILHDFNEKVISLMTEFLKNSIMKGGLSNFTENLNDKLMELGYDLTKFSLEYAEDIIFKLKERKNQFQSIEKDERKIITIFGEIDFKRRYYIDKETEKRVYLLDEYFKLGPKERLLENVETRLIEEAIETNYEKAGKVVAYKTEISKQTVINKISELKINIEEEKNITRKVVENIYCIADEDHVHLQRGGIEEPRLIVVYDSIIKEGKRIKLCNKKHFGGVYKGKIDELWEEVLTYIENTYEIDKVKNIYILGDGANKNLYKNKKELHGCSAEGHISHLYSARLSSRPLGWKTINVNNVSKLRLLKADNKEIKEIVNNQRKVIEFKEIEKIKHYAKEKIKESINFKSATIPTMELGTTEQRKFFKQLLEYNKAV